MAKMVNYMNGDYGVHDDPAVKHLQRSVSGSRSPKSSPQGGCSLVILAVTVLSAVLTAAGSGIANVIV
ncbi:hypothetical protein [Marinitenerispora sediminis]|nr:hypothetical protein [Marinitenerispora sediminis]